MKYYYIYAKTKREAINYIEQSNERYNYKPGRELNNEEPLHVFKRIVTKDSISFVYVKKIIK